jgi:hypothetical protein
LADLVQHSLQLVGVRAGDDIPPDEELPQRVIGEGITLAWLLHCEEAWRLAIGCLLVVLSYGRS